MLKISKYTIIAFILLTSCGPKSIIPEKDMVLILAKIHIIDVTIQNQNFRSTLYNKDTIDYFSRTIQSYGYTKAQFDSSLSFYSKRPSDLDAIYDKVIIELSKTETEILAKNKAYEDSVARDTLRNLWNLNPSFELPKDSVQETIDFIIPVKDLGVYTIKADVCVHLDDESIDPSMVAYFYFDDKSKLGARSGSISKSYIKSDSSQTITIKMDLQNSLVTHLKGSLMSHKNMSNDFKKHSSVSNIKVLYKPGKLKRFKPIRKESRLEKVEK